jgi:hypothetical protein
MAEPIGSTSGSCGLVVLGHHTRRDGTAHPIQRWRVQIARRSIGGARDVRIVVAGGPRGDGPSEARVMAQYAGSLGLDGHPVLLEERATTTGSARDGG